MPSAARSFVPCGLARLSGRYPGIRFRLLDGSETSPVYDTIVRMAQDFSMRYPLVDGQGNFGSVDGDSAAAMRYTEVRMERITEELLADLDKDTVDFTPNYDDSLTEPAVMPSRIPNLLINGSTGIAVGMATNIPPHNLGEVCDALVALIEQPELTVDELMRFIPGPDFPTAGFICGQSAIRSAYHEGRYYVGETGQDTSKVLSTLAHDVLDYLAELAAIPDDAPLTQQRAMVAAELMGSVYWRLLQKLERRRFDVFGPKPTRLNKGQKCLLILRTMCRFISGAMSPNYGA